MNKEEKDPQLGPPQEANTGKHINFLEAEENNDNTPDRDTSDDESPAKKAWKEMREDMKNRQPKNEQ